MTGLFAAIDHSIVRAERHATNGGARARRNTRRDLSQLLERRAVEHRVQQLIELRRSNAENGFALVDELLGYQINSDANCRGTGAFTIASLEHVERALLDGELEVLHIAVILLQALRDRVELLVGLQA